MFNELEWMLIKYCITFALFINIIIHIINMSFKNKLANP